MFPFGCAFRLNCLYHDKLENLYFNALNNTIRRLYFDRHEEVQIDSPTFNVPETQRFSQSVY